MRKMIVILVGMFATNKGWDTSGQQWMKVWFEEQNVRV